MEQATSSPVDGPLAHELARVRRAELAPALRMDLSSYSGPDICFGIMWAGGLYPLITGTITGAFMLVLFVWNFWFQTAPAIGLIEMALVPLIFAAYAVIGGLLTMLWTGILAMIALPIVYLVVRSLQLHGNLIRLAAFSGGLVGFLAMLPVTLTLPWTAASLRFTELSVALALGPGLATVLGQLGGIWGGMRAAHSIANYYGLPLLHLFDDAIHPNSLINDLTDQHAPDDRSHLRFGIRHVMWLTVWLSILLAMVRLTGIPFGVAFSVILGWLVFQWVSLRLSLWLLRWAGPKWAAWRARRST